MLKMLIELNKGIRNHFGIDNRNVFITQNGTPMNINAHAIRRAYAKNLHDKGASIALISKALGHSDLAVTTQYLDLDVEEVAKDLRDYL